MSFETGTAVRWFCKGAYESHRIHVVLFSCGMCCSCISLTISPQLSWCELGLPQLGMATRHLDCGVLLLLHVELIFWPRVSCRFRVQTWVHYKEGSILKTLERIKNEAMQDLKQLHRTKKMRYIEGYVQKVGKSRFTNSKQPPLVLLNCIAAAVDGKLEGKSIARDADLEKQPSKIKIIVFQAIC